MATNAIVSRRRPTLPDLFASRPPAGQSDQAIAERSPPAQIRMKSGKFLVVDL